ncbi:hypothetical protein [Burkholderia gladioli]|uniref:hypothetical protein n=1 Tax=Burkholderia gladioli TaxID=28095 RepID=UPI001640F9F0|nr:hypothetical protein [Burkholderia gladioli]
MSPQTDKNTDFENLVRNGLEFLEKAISQLDSDAKHSVINFYTAVEIFLKAPLVVDHWSLVIANQDPDRQKYLSGDFVSVGFDDACKRLGSALGKGLRQSTKDAFDKIRKHRNRMVHFYHNASSPKEKEAIRLEQAEAWFELHRFVTDMFRDEFAPFAQEFTRMERHLSLTQHYASVKFASLKQKIDGKKRGGAVFSVCVRCKQPSSEQQVIDCAIPEVRRNYCHVCLRQETLMTITCPNCQKPDQTLEQASQFVCTQCNHTVDEDDIFDLLEQAFYGPDDLMDADTPANCDECQGYHKVCSYNSKYLCTNCFSIFDHLYRCGYCNDPMTQERDDSYVSGCEHCDGKYVADD